MTKEEAQAEHDAYVRMAGWALDQATRIRREHGLDMSSAEEQAWEKETNA